MRINDLKSPKALADADWKKYQKERPKDTHVQHFDKNGKKHRTDGPAFIGPHFMMWEQDGYHHRDINEGPAYIYRDTPTSSRSDARRDGETYFMNGMKVHGPNGLLHTMRHTGSDRIANEERSHGDTETPAYTNDMNMTIKGHLRLVGFRFGKIFPDGFDYNRWITDGPYFRMRVWEDENVDSHHVPRRANGLPGVVFDEYHKPDGFSISVWFKAGMIHNQEGPAIVAKAYGETYNFWCIDDEMVSVEPSDEPPQEWLTKGGKING